MGFLKKVAKNVAYKNIFLSKKMMENQVVSKKSILSNNCMPIFNFCHDLKDFETGKCVFLQVKKSPIGTRVFFVANCRVKLSMVIRFGCVLVVKLGQIIDHDEYCTIIL